MHKQKLLRQVDILYLVIFFVLTYGILYYSYKWYGHASDFYYYYEMYKSPLYGDTIAPFHYRRLTPLLVHLVSQLGIYYPLDITFSDPEVRQRLWFAAILVNYGGIVLSAVMAAKITDLLIEREGITGAGRLVPVFAGTLIFFSFLMLQKTLTPMNDGLTWFFTAALFYAVLSERPALFGVLTVVGVAHREMIPVLGAAFVFLPALIRGWHISGLGGFIEHLLARWAYIAFCAVSMLLYGLYRILDPVSGNEQQVQPLSIITNIIDRIILNPEISIEMLLNGYLSQNILIIFLVLVVWRWRRLVFETRVDILVLLILVPSLYLLGYGVGMGSSIGRFGGWLTPCMTPFIAILMLPAKRGELPA